jgi:hypothetical protein
MAHNEQLSSDVVKSVLSYSAKAVQSTSSTCRYSGMFTAETAHGTQLAVQASSNTLIHSDSIGFERLLAYVHIPPWSRSAFILFDNPDLHPLVTRPNSILGPIIVARRRTLSEGEIAFSDPCRRIYMTAHPITADGVAMVDFADHDVGEQQKFRLTAVAARNLPPAVADQVRVIETLVATSPIYIVDLLRHASAADRPVILALATETLVPAEVERLVDHLFSNPTLLADLAAVAPDDPWAQRGLPALWRFMEGRRAEAIRLSGPAGSWPASPPMVDVIGPELDQLAPRGIGGVYTSLPHRCMIEMRKRTAPIKDVCIVATARDDGLYLIDWIAYHRAIGVEGIFLYTNDNVDGSDVLLRALAAAGEISLIESHLSPTGVSPVGKAYGHALSMVPEVLDYRWCAIIDSDEFIGIDRALFGSLSDYIAWQELQPVDCVALSWVVFGSSGALRWKDEPLPERFHERYLDVHIKSIFRTREFHHAMPHFPYTDHLTQLIWRDAAGHTFPGATPWSPAPRDDPAWIAHFFYRSFEEYVWKFLRGRGDQPLDGGLHKLDVPDGFMESFVRQQAELPLTRDVRLLAFSEETNGHAAVLRNLPGVADAIAQIRRFYRRRSDALRPTLLQSRKEASPQQAKFYDLFLEQPADD